MDDEYQIEIRLEIPEDRDGFFRRECPSCEQQFKAFAGEHDSGVVTHYCPLCGEPESADNENWLTPEQAEFARDSALAGGLDDLMDQIFKDASSKHFKMKRTGSMAPEPPSPITEPNDMSIVIPPCHEDEPVKVPEDLPGPFFCLVCGEQFAV